MFGVLWCGILGMIVYPSVIFYAEIISLLPVSMSVRKNISDMLMYIDDIACTCKYGKPRCDAQKRRIMASLNKNVPRPGEDFKCCPELSDEIIMALLSGVHLPAHMLAICECKKERVYELGAKLDLLSSALNSLGINLYNYYSGPNDDPANNISPLVQRFDNATQCDAMLWKKRNKWL